jgi:hypothetical protein
MLARRVSGVACVVIMLPALAGAQGPTYDYDTAAPFATYLTYAFKAGTSTGDPLVDARIVDAIEGQLALKGMIKTGIAPDVYVLFHLALDKQKDISAGSTGTLAIDIVDVRRQQVAWRGLGTKEVDTAAGPDKRDKDIAKAVAKILRHYPPAADDD